MFPTFLRGCSVKILFLDIDGVLNSRRYDRTRDWTKQTDIDESRLPLLAQIISSTGAVIVLSSTWRVHWNRDASLCDEDGRYIDETFAKYGMRVFDKTPVLGRDAGRKDEINAYLASAEGVEKFAVLDDYRFGWGELADFVVLTNPHRGSGLEREHVQKTIALLI